MKTILLGLLALGFLGCSEVKNLHEMKDSTANMERTTARMAQVTEQMAQTTGEMAKTTERMATTTDAMADKMTSMYGETKSLSSKSSSLLRATDELYDALRQGTALQVRHEVWKSILAGRSMYQKMVDSGKYFMSFEMQLWNDFGQDGTQWKRDSLAQQAAKEFFFQIEDLVKRDGSVDVTAEPTPEDIRSEENRQASFNALSLALSQTNRKQHEVLSRLKDTKVITMQSLLLEALEAKSTIESGDAEKLGTRLPFIREILIHEEKAVRLLQTQINLAPLVFIDVVTKLQDKGLLKKAKMTFVSWELDLEKVSLNDLEYYYDDLIVPALEAKAVLKKLGYNDKLVYPVKNIFASMKVKPFIAATSSKRLSVQEKMLSGILAFDK